MNILRKRNDGYHDLETIMLELPFTDVLEIVPSSIEKDEITLPNDQFTTSGLPIPGNGNLCLDALALLRKDFSIPKSAIHLLKMIPMGGGLGGGSADAAFMLKLLNDVYQLLLSDEQLEAYAAQLGSDCAFFIKGGLQLCEGRGEVLSEMDIHLPHMYVVLVNFGIHISTQLAFSAVVPNENRRPLVECIQLPKEEWKTTLKNDFETSVFPEFPILEEAKNELYEMGAFYAAMSGSGSTLYGLFETKPSELQFSIPPLFLKIIEVPSL